MKYSIVFCPKKDKLVHLNEPQKKNFLTEGLDRTTFVKLAEKDILFDFYGSFNI